MTRIRYSDFHEETAAYGHVYGLPEHTACGVWQSSPDQDTSLKYSASFYADSPADSITTSIRIESPLNVGLAEAPAGVGWTQSATLDEYPSVPVLSSPSDTRDFAVPYFAVGIGLGHCSALNDSSGTGTYWGARVWCAYDEIFSSFGDGEYMELTDYSSGDSFAANASAASCVIRNIGARAYNRITYTAPWEINFVIFPVFRQT